jgi:hypothetical protein
MKHFWNGFGTGHLSLISKRTLVLSFFVTLLCMTFLTPGIASAHASHTLRPYGTNGQQLAFWIGDPSVKSVEVTGYNQNNGLWDACYPDWNTGQVSPYQWNYFSNWWWVGQVRLIYYTSPGCINGLITTQWVNVPTFQVTDYYCVYVLNRKSPPPC